MAPLASAELPLPHLPLVGSGTVVRSSRQYKELPTTIRTFLEAGGRLIDTASSYGGTEAKLAEPLSRVARSELFVISKISIPSMGYESTLRQVNATLASLRTRYVDLMLVHRPNNAPGRKGERDRHDARPAPRHVRVSVEAQQPGLVRFVGVSNFGIIYLRELEEAGLPPPAANECP